MRILRRKIGDKTTLRNSCLPSNALQAKKRAKAKEDFQNGTMLPAKKKPVQVRGSLTVKSKPKGIGKIRILAKPASTRTTVVLAKESSLMIVGEEREAPPIEIPGLRAEIERMKEQDRLREEQKAANPVVRGRQSFSNPDSWFEPMH